MTRGISFASGTKFFGKIVRVPAAAGGAVVAGIAYVNYQVQEAANYTQKKIEQATDWVTSTASSVKDGIENLSTPRWLKGLFDSSTSDGQHSSRSEHDEGSSHDTRNKGIVKQSSNNENGDGGGGGEEAALAGAAAAAATAALSDEDAEERVAATNAQMMLLTRKMIEIRNILQEISTSGGGQSLTRVQLPSIVVVGSQSSGKSSVLEAIVGHEFLPKGNNMVTRRPIELTLVNSPDAAAEYGEFPALKLGKITDFAQIQKTLTDLNLAIPDSEAVSDDPIRLNIYSPHVPDLTLIDLPGYIQIAAADQPESLKSKIASLCDKYIAAPNIILAISAADVDLANSTALRAAKRIDPRGERTIGVITKLDLVDPSRAVDLLQNRNYPLQMGYVGVVSKVPTSLTTRASSGLLSRFSGSGDSSDIGSVIAKNEELYFGRHPAFTRALTDTDDRTGQQQVTLGVINLRNKLMRILERTMAKNLQPTCDAIHQELEETAYQFKVEYNDRPITAESYLAQSLDSFKLSFKEFTGKFGREQVRAMLKSELDQRVLDLLAQRYWNRLDEESTSAFSPLDDIAIKAILRPVSELPNALPDDVYWHRQLDACVSNLTKSGVGRTSTTLVSNALSGEMEHLVNSGAFKTHPYVKTIVQDATMEILSSRFYSTADQVENCIKPYKYEVEVEDREWSRSREHAFALLKDELRQCEAAYYKLQRSVGGGKKLSQVEKFVERNRKGVVKMEDANEVYGFSQALIEKAGREGLFLTKRADVIRLRMQALKSKQCKSKDNKYYCPEIFLDVVADKLTQTAVLFLNVELLSDFYYHLPRELDARLGHGLGPQQMENFAKENAKVRRHLELQERKQKLELATEKIESVIAMQKTTRLQPA
ncbi:hypothetical protein V1519DRAFT_384620 [Lipomyces tetrasporus]